VTGAKHITLASCFSLLWKSTPNTLRAGF